MGDLDPSNIWFLGSTWIFIPNGISITSSVYAQFTVEFHYTLQWAATPPKLPLSFGDLHPSNTWFFVPTQVSSPNGISIGSAGSHCKWQRRYFWKRPNFRLWWTRGLDLDPGSGHTAYRRASLMDLHLHSKFNWSRRTDGHTHVHMDGRTALLGRLCRTVDLIKFNQPSAIPKISLGPENLKWVTWPWPWPFLGVVCHP